MRSALLSSALLSFALPASGCLLYGGTSSHGGGHPVENRAPVVDWADSSCYWDDYYGDDVWWFQADITDEDGLDDITGVYADVYDGRSGEWVDAFELYFDAGNTWYSAWQADSTYLDCAYYDYIVDFTAEDSVGPGDIYTLDVY